VVSPPSRVKEEIIRERSVVVCVVVFARRVLDDIIFVVVYAFFCPDGK